MHSRNGEPSARPSWPSSSAPLAPLAWCELGGQAHEDHDGPAGNTPIVAATAAIGLILGFALFGQVILDYLHISLQSLSIAAGLLLLLVAIENAAGHGMTPTPGRGVALVPLATPSWPAKAPSLRSWSSSGATPERRAAWPSSPALAKRTSCSAWPSSWPPGWAKLIPLPLARFLTRAAPSAIAVQLIVDGVRVLIEAG